MQTNGLSAGSVGCYCGDLHASCVVAESSDNQAAARDVNKFLQQLRGEQITDIIPHEPAIKLRLSERPWNFLFFTSSNSRHGRNLGKQ